MMFMKNYIDFPVFGKTLLPENFSGAFAPTFVQCRHDVYMLSVTLPIGYLVLLTHYLIILLKLYFIFSSLFEIILTAS